jgi:hypothetical protein
MAEVGENVGSLMARSTQLGRDPDFEEVREAYLTTYRQNTA